MKPTIRQTVRNLLQEDPYLTPYESELELQLERLARVRSAVLKDRSPSEFANGYLYYGFQKAETEWIFREWLPAADRVFLMGDFNGWNQNSHPLTRLPGGDWELRLPLSALSHGQYVKLLVEHGGDCFERIPAYIRRATLDPCTSRLCGQIWMPENPFPWTDQGFCGRKPDAPLLIYEAHVGMAQEKEGIGTYREFAERILPRIAEHGYNTVQLMAIQEHPYYASFGYQITNLFAPSHRFGTPEDLKYLINEAHRLGLSVLLDIVHAHASGNEGEGLFRQDGSDGYFLPGERGRHPAWGTLLYDYGKGEVLHFLLSNLKYWLTEFHVDGFRFDGVTSMLYQDHGLGRAFTDYGMYYGLNTNLDALTYLRLANDLVHEVLPRAVTVAEEMSGMPGMCLPLNRGGVGFDYRLAMGIPDTWIRLVKDVRFEDWDLFSLHHELTTHRTGEKSVSYCESHDQALVGDLTLIFRIARSEMYTGMSTGSENERVDIACDYHKIIRFATLFSAQGGYLNFMGNEFGHPEWIDFPREGNGWSYLYARRQWSLAEDPFLRYRFLDRFDRAIIALAASLPILEPDNSSAVWIDNQRKILSFARAGLLFVVNFHPTVSATDAFVPVPDGSRAEYRVILSSDSPDFGGQGRISEHYLYAPEKRGDRLGFPFYLPCRSAAVLAPVSRG
ncbi:MAG: alpha amylase C-terminal domain-containing protein [Clostridia bacterium]|nr:alpha amylase C-terminal domain-containing protein [Clostridia bacterium]